MFSHTLDSSSDDELVIVVREDPQFQANSNDFKVAVPEFEGKLDLEDFLDWIRSSHAFCFFLRKRLSCLGRYSFWACNS